MERNGKTLRIADLTLDEIVVGMRVKGLATGRIGTIVDIDHVDDEYSYVQWDGDDKPTSGFYYSRKCQIEVVSFPEPEAGKA